MTLFRPNNPIWLIIRAGVEEGIVFHVISTRPLEDALIDADVLAEAGITCLPAPMMTINPIDIDLDSLADTDDVGAVALTSRHAVGIIAGSRWANYPVFCVGDSTARLAIDAGMTQVMTGAGDGQGLAELISTTSHRKIFWPSAVDVGFDLAKPLAEHGITVVRHPVYKAAETHSLSDEVLAAFRDEKIKAVMVHSGRAGVHLADGMAQYGLNDLMPKIDVIAVSARVGGQCKAGRDMDGWRRIIIAASPRRSAMFEAVTALKQDQLSSLNLEGI